MMPRTRPTLTALLAIALSASLIACGDDTENRRRGPADAGDTVDAGDDGGLTDADDVDADPAVRCGDGEVSGSEQCDGTELGGASCETLGFEGGTLGCTDSCRLDATACEGVAVGCGDGELASNEQCEGFELRGETCQSQGFYEGQLACLPSCVLDTSDCSGVCGDGEVNGDEVCDDGVNDGSYGSCLSDCSANAAFCGDGEINGNELCDDGVNDESYGGCLSDCSANAARCGDLVRNGPEPCDGDDFGDDSCQARGYDRGELSCFAGCQPGPTTCALEFESLTAGSSQTCALRPGGVARCWGNNGDGQTNVPAGETFIALATTSFRSCGVTTVGDVTCWGRTAQFDAAPSQPVTSISLSGWTGCGLNAANEVVCWGNDSNGEVSNRPTGTYSAIAQVSSAVCAIATDGTIDCWGSTINDATTPPAGTFTKIAGGFRHFCAIATDGTLSCWGGNVNNAAVPPSGTFLDVALGEDVSCALRTDGTLECWGKNELDQADPPTGTYVSLSMGSHHGCALDAQGQATCWGSNTRGQLNVPTTP